MKRITYLSIILAGTLTFSCNSFLEPEMDNRLSEDQLLDNPALAEGLLLKAYDAMPNRHSFEEDIVTDDALTNNFNSDFLKIATGQWKSTNNPLSKWDQAYEQIFYINTFLEKYKDVQWSYESETVNDLHLQKLRGEALGLRAWWQFQLLQAHAGEGSGNLLGFPIVSQALDVDDNWKLSRGNYADCVNQILEDCDEALANLSYAYEDGDDSQVNQVFGARWSNRINGMAVDALRSRVTLYAASPAFNQSNDAGLWDNAAKVAAKVLDDNGGLDALSPSGVKFYEYNNGNDADVIWARAISSSSNWEADNFPPSLNGNGFTNPSQNLVDAFPMANGYPIDDAMSGYDENDPYAGRDPRLSTYVLYNGNSLGSKGAIFTHVGAPLDGIQEQTNSTRTGYYLKKFMLDNVNVENPTVDQNHFYTYFRFTEVFLNYAEAANEAYGPDADGAGVGFTARDVIAAIRIRAGIDELDPYLASVTAKEDFRKLIRNERRLELCFEGHRFWDLRRWKDTNMMKTPVNGVYISVDGNSFDYKSIEERKYEDFMIYGPIPYEETLKYDGLIQNDGWL